MMKTKYINLSVLWVVLSFSTLPVLASPITYEIAGTFNLVSREVNTGITYGADKFMSIQFTVTDPTERPETPFNPNVGEFSVSSAFVTVPFFGLLDMQVTNQNLTLFQFDNGYFEQFGLFLILQGGYAELVFEENGLDFIENPNKPLPLKSNLSGLTLFISGGWDTGLNLADGSILGFGGNIYSFKDGATGGTIRNVQPVPEPATMILLGFGLAGIVGIRLRKKK